MVEMTTVFKLTVRPILIMSKWLGIINVSYVLEPAGLLVPNTHSSYYSFLEISRMCFLLLCSYIALVTGTPFLQWILLLKFWFVVVASRISEAPLIKLINGIIEYDRKLLTILPKFALDDDGRRSSRRKINWKRIVAGLSAYFVGFELYLMSTWSPGAFNVSKFVTCLFSPPFVVDFAVVFSSYFYLDNIEIRFQTLNDCWKCVPVGLVAVPGRLTHCEIARMVDDIRLLHAELSELLKTFSAGYGLLLLGFFTFSFVNMLIQFFFTICVNVTTSELFFKNIVRNSIPHVLNAQVVFFMMLTIVAVSRIHAERRRIVSYLRLYRISNLPLDIKRQVKMFLLQISVFESDEITAFGFFNINLNLVISILVLLLTGLSTLIQMKDHPIIRKFVNDTRTYFSIFVETFTIEMTTVFKTTIKPILIMSKLFGIINMSYVLEPAGLLVRNTNSTYYSFLEILRMAALLLCTFIVSTARLTVLFYILLIKCWVVVITARIFETSLIKLINGIIEFDKKLSLLPKFLSDRQRTYSKTYWKKLIVVSSLYFIAFDLCQVYLWPPHSVQISIILEYFFAPPYVIDFVVIVSSYFYLYNIKIRFEMLNDFWQRVPAGLVAVPGQFTHCEIAILIETVRLLHAELSELLKTFSMGYGPLVLGFFFFSYLNMSIQFFFMICINLTVTGQRVGNNIARNAIIHILNVQVLFLMTSTILAVSRIHEKRRKFVSYLRSYRISYLPLDIKRQVKLFMNQISVFDYDEVTAFGFFNINLNLVLSILVLLVTGLSTLVQMKDHPVILKLANDTTNVMKTSFDNIP